MILNACVVRLSAAAVTSNDWMLPGAKTMPVTFHYLQHRIESSQHRA
jgi:hypothetical protein